jgi:deoxyribose-phosphate aldolase
MSIETLPGASVARFIDHTILKPDATDADIMRLCQEAKKFGFAAVCINPPFVPLAAEQLRGTAIKVCSVVGFPLGAHPSDIKAQEALWAIQHGAQEIDMVIPIGQLKMGRFDVVKKDIVTVVQAMGSDAIVKVILETCLLTNDEIIKGCEIAVSAGALFVKTSTGFSKEGATLEAVALMRKTVGPDIGVKAAGGIRTLEKTHAFLAVGANRIGTSSGVQIVEGSA